MTAYGLLKGVCFDADGIFQARLGTVEFRNWRWTSCLGSGLAICRRCEPISISK
jgi:hypothetical protein